MPTVTVTFVQERLCPGDIYPHQVTDPILTKLFGLNFFQHNFFNPIIFETKQEQQIKEKQNNMKVIGL